MEWSGASTYSAAVNLVESSRNNGVQSASKTNRGCFWLLMASFFALSLFYYYYSRAGMVQIVLLLIPDPNKIFL